MRRRGRSGGGLAGWAMLFGLLAALLAVFWFLFVFGWIYLLIIVAVVGLVNREAARVATRRRW
ncbi:MAG TPA: hypothetical protein VGR35_01260 [Tepidisphaeraceae bacterium]|nr:hypothetical protein [Tepidisphaeraceae bacterium]